MKKRIIDALLSTKRENMEQMIDWMDENGFFTAPCSGNYHLAHEEGLAEHSLNVMEQALALADTLDKEKEFLDRESVIIAALLHDLGKTGQFGKPNYIPNMLKGRATKANPNPESYQSPKKPFVTNPDLLYVDHEIRSIQIASQFIELTEDESFAILNHNGMYSNLRYAYSGKETPLSLIIHWADMWAARVLEVKEKTDSDADE